MFQKSKKKLVEILFKTMKNCLKLSCLRIFFSNISKVRITNIRPLRWYNTSKCSFQNLLFSILVCSGFLQFLCRYFLQIFFFSFFCWWYSLTGLLILQSFAVTFRCPTTFHFAQPRDSFFCNQNICSFIYVQNICSISNPT